MQFLYECPLGLLGQMVYDAAHREVVWERTPVGATIPYIAASELTQIG